MDNGFDIDKVNLLMDEGIDITSRTIYLSDNYDSEGEDEISAISTEKLFKALTVLNNINAEDITIVLNTSGGDTHQGMVMYDMIKTIPCKVTIKVIGSAHSMGSIILQAADKRIMSKHSTMLLHYGQTSIDAESDNFKRWQKEYERIEEVMEKILLNRMKKKNISKKKLKDMMKFDTILNAEQALKLGLIDEIE